MEEALYKFVRDEKYEDALVDSIFYSWFPPTIMYRIISWGLLPNSQNR